jgi:hypothetical protein
MFNLDPFLMLGWMSFFVIAILVILIVFYIIVFRKLFVKTNHKGYESLVSWHNIYVMITIAGKEWRYIFLFLIPSLLIFLLWLINWTLGSIVGVLWVIYLYGDLTFSTAKRFGKGIWFGIGMLLLPIIWIPILALGKSIYTPKK